MLWQVCYQLSRPYSWTDGSSDKLSGSKGDFAVPTIAEMGFGQPTTSIRGGTTAGHEKLSNFLSHPDDVATFSKPRTAPSLGALGYARYGGGARKLSRDGMEREGKRRKSLRICLDSLSSGICMPRQRRPSRTLSGYGGTACAGGNKHLGSRGRLTDDA
jgi:hypothetical protein